MYSLNPRIVIFDDISTDVCHLILGPIYLFVVAVVHSFKIKFNSIHLASSVVGFCIFDNIANLVFYYTRTSCFYIAYCMMYVTLQACFFV